MEIFGYALGFCRWDLVALIVLIVVVAVVAGMLIRLRFKRERLRDEVLGQIPDEVDRKDKRDSKSEK